MYTKCSAHVDCASNYKRRKQILCLKRMGHSQEQNERKYNAEYDQYSITNQSNSKPTHVSSTPQLNSTYMCDVSAMTFNSKISDIDDENTPFLYDDGPNQIPEFLQRTLKKRKGKVGRQHKKKAAISQDIPIQLTVQRSLSAEQPRKSNFNIEFI